jgi:hypothetical protein
MRQPIPPNLRLLVIAKAKNCCEYCGVHESDQFWSYHVDHIISVKHGGLTEFLNLAFSCSICNLLKGTDLGTYLVGHSRLIRLFNPRKDSWQAHFSILNGEILPKTLIAAATIKVLDLNNADRIILRQALTDISRYPMK